uniref:DCC-interacting protein 13-alpha n=1 Tax=Cyprinus carpio carpio TaxID=630221 RepID=A0A9J7ZHA8_CYPCA
MPGIDKLPIEETLEDSPQTRSLLGVFEEDTAAISSYFSQLFKAMQRIYDAQNELSAATHLTSKLLKDYEKQRFPLGGDDEVMSSTLQQFAKVIDELSSCHAVLSTQLADAMMFPITQFQERDLRVLASLCATYLISDHDAAINRYSRLSKRKENEKVKNEVMEDVYTSRKKQHETTMHYFASLNMLQYKKKIALLEPLLGYMQAQISFFKLGSENLTQQWEEFLTNIGTSVQNVRREMDSDAEATEQTIQDLKAASDPLYMPDPDPNQIPVNRNLTRKAGYLNTRYKTGLVSSAWERQYFFTQGGNLMSQSRGAVAGGLVLDIDNCSVMAVDCDDRRFCFQITAFDGKKYVFLAHKSCTDLTIWIATINNISKRIYLSENPEVSVEFRFTLTLIHENLNPCKYNKITLMRFDVSCSDRVSHVVSDSILHQLFIVRFLGSMEVKATESADVIYETMRQILAARAIHNIFRMTESHLLVTCESLKLIDPQTQVTRLRFPLSSVVLCASHQENKRLFGFVLKTAGGREDGRPVTVCYVFESNNDGEKICDSVGLAKQIALHSEMVRKLFIYLISNDSICAEMPGQIKFDIANMHEDACFFFLTGPQSHTETERAGQSQGETTGRTS